MTGGGVGGSACTDRTHVLGRRITFPLTLKTCPFPAEDMKSVFCVGHRDLRVHLGGSVLHSDPMAKYRVRPQTRDGSGLTPAGHRGWRRFSQLRACDLVLNSGMNAHVGRWAQVHGDPADVLGASHSRRSHLAHRRFRHLLFLSLGCPCS